MKNLKNHNLICFLKILLELGVVSNSGGKPEDATSMHDERSEYRSSMKRSKSDDGQLDGRSPGPSRRAVSPDTASEDRGYGTLVDMDTKVSEIKDFVRVQSDKASKPCMMMICASTDSLISFNSFDFCLGYYSRFLQKIERDLSQRLVDGYDKNTFVYKLIVYNVISLITY